MCSTLTSIYDHYARITDTSLCRSSHQLYSNRLSTTWIVLGGGCGLANLICREKFDINREKNQSQKNCLQSKKLKTD